ncbi:hypothetical protein NDU88_002649 [Pleurodeles waltl]|uniref:Uncharacterized protein n=1 Tax=Pleurodeles waltl TaxID=8319 RepID=A0AAV7KT92_PLEWA|nr:hypothetical protein NDU88_002649 [Pleurodeles waltl]
MWLPFLILCSLGFRSKASSAAVGPTCSQYQVVFNSSCFEFVKLKRTFSNAQSWCERGGGHLVFIEDNGTQEFLQMHVSEDREWWIGLAWDYASNDTSQGSLVWLDGSNISYSKWHRNELPQASAKCGYILQSSGYSWGATENCSQEFYFICEFESGQTIACDYYNATVQCGSGEVVQISESTYGRRSPHYCTLEGTSPTELTSGCSWVNVKEQVSGQCHGLQACQVSADAATFGEPCPALGSYLSITYKCMEGLKLTVDDECSMLENVTITLQWMLSPYTGNLSCIINPGDGYTIDYQLLNLSSSVIHMFKAPGEYTIFVECTTSEWHVTAQKTVIVQGSVDELAIDGCYSKQESSNTNSSSCGTLYGETLWIQVQLRGGRNVTYSVMAGNVTLVVSSEKYGITPHNLTLDRASQQLIGPGTHQLKIIATSNTTISETSQNITVHLVEPVIGLEASLNSPTVKSGADLLINVSIEQGAPIDLKFEITGINGTFHHPKDGQRGKPQLYRIPVTSEGIFLVRVLAGNAFSNMSKDIGNITVLCDTSPKDSQNSSSASRDPATRPPRARGAGEELCGWIACLLQRLSASEKMGCSIRGPQGAGAPWDPWVAVCGLRMMVRLPETCGVGEELWSTAAGSPACCGNWALTCGQGCFTPYCSWWSRARPPTAGAPMESSERLEVDDGPRGEDSQAEAGFQLRGEASPGTPPFPGRDCQT